MPDFLHNREDKLINKEQKTVVPELDVAAHDSDSTGKSGFAGVLINGVFWSFLENVTEPTILLRKVRDKVNAVIQISVVALLLASLTLGTYSLYLYFDSVTEAMRALFEMNRTFGFSALFLAALAAQFLFYRVQEKKLRRRQVPKSKTEIPEVMVIPALEHAGRHSDIALVFSEAARLAVEEAYMLAKRAGSERVLPLHLCVGTLSSQTVSMLFVRLGINFDQIKDALRRRIASYPKGNTVMEIEARKVIAGAMRNACQYNRPQLGTIELFLESYRCDEFLQELFFL